MLYCVNGTAVWMLRTHRVSLLYCHASSIPANLTKNFKFQHDSLRISSINFFLRSLLKLKIFAEFNFQMVGLHLKFLQENSLPPKF